MKARPPEMALPPPPSMTRGHDACHAQGQEYGRYQVADACACARLSCPPQDLSIKEMECLKPISRSLLRGRDGKETNGVVWNSEETPRPAETCSTWRSIVALSFAAW